MLELAILGLLENRDLHGYEIRKRLRDELGFFANVSFGALYPALSKLERAGAVTTVEEHGAPSALPVPMTGSLGGERAALRALRPVAARSRRSRRVYRVTDAGRSLFAELLQAEGGSSADDARGFGLRLAFARHLAPPSRIRLFERRRAQVAERLAATRAVASPGSGLDAYVRSLLEHTAESAEHEIAWLDGLIDAEALSVAAGAGDVTTTTIRTHPPKGA